MLRFIIKKSISIHLDFLLYRIFGFLQFSNFCYLDSTENLNTGIDKQTRLFGIPTPISVGFFAFIYIHRRPDMTLDTKW